MFGMKKFDTEGQGDSLVIVRKRRTEWIDRMTELEFIISAIDNRAEFESYAESDELAGLDGFELEPVEFEPYDNEGSTVTEWSNN